MKKFRNKYRIASARAPWWNYSANGYYFITMCTANRKCLFGNIVKGAMQLSAIGEIASEEWHKSFEIRNELFCDAFVIMPNHIHAVLRIDNPDIVVLPPPRPIRPPKSISSFVAGFKSAATKRINEFRNMPEMPVWQSRFHDHIIRDEGEYRRIVKYIRENPAKWPEDKFRAQL